jgi:flavin-dependent dehydrogenase
MAPAGQKHEASEPHASADPQGARREQELVQHASGGTERYDVIVAGAGPAGIMAAAEAAERGTVLLVEASSLPRNKSCGGMLNEYSQEFLAPLGSLPREIVLQPEHVNFRYWDWDRRIRKPTELRFANVDRRGFDSWLLSRLPDSVHVLENCSLEDFSLRPDGVSVSLRTGEQTLVVECDNLVGADGARSLVRRALGIGSVATYVTLQDWVPLSGELEPYFDCIYMRSIGDSFAYSYVVPKGGSAIVGSVYYPKTKRPHEKQDLTLGMLRERLPQLGEPQRREAWAALHVRSAADVVLGHGRVLLAGEAAGFMSPTSGEGISYALNSGRLAGRAIAGSHPDQALASYAVATRRIRANIARKLRWLPVMESRVGKYLGGLAPTPLVSHMTRGL